MAGTLVISTLSDGTNSTSSTNCIQGSAKAWVNFNGSGAATIRASYNVSSVTYTSAGSYVVNFTTAMPDANYSISGSAGWDGTNYLFMGIRNTGTQTFPPTTTSCPVFTSVTNSTLPSNWISVTFNR